MGSITVGKILKNFRKENQLTQRELVIMVYRMSEDDLQDIRNKMMFFSAIENDKSPLPIHLINRVAEVTQTNAGYIIDCMVQRYRERITKLTNRSK